MREEREKVIEELEKDYENIKNLSIHERLKQFEYTPRQYISIDDNEIACPDLIEGLIVDLVTYKENEETEVVEQVVEKKRNYN